MEDLWKDYHFIFDLEKCIDSSHRVSSTSGEGLLERRLYDSRPEMVFKDSLKGPTYAWKWVKLAGSAQVTVLTSKRMDSAQLDFLEFHHLEYDRMMSRSEIDVSPDAQLRVRQLDELASDIGIAREALLFCECGAQIMLANFSQLPEPFDEQ